MELQEEGDQESLAGISRAIRAKFLELEQLWSHELLEIPTRQKFLDTSERFELWAVNIGVYSLGHSSLDYRFRDAPGLLGFTRKLLKDLDGYLITVHDILVDIPPEQNELRTSNQRPMSHNDTQRAITMDKLPLSTSTDTHNLPLVGVANSEPYQIEVKDDSDNSSEESLGSYADDSVLQNTLDALVDSLDRLYRLSTNIRNPRTRTGTSKARSFKQVDKDTDVDLMEAYVPFEKAHIQELFANFQDKSPPDFRDHYLVNRLVSANQRRRQQFGHWQRHHLKLKRESSHHPQEVLKESTPELIKEPPKPQLQVERSTVYSKPTTASRLDPTLFNAHENNSVISDHTVLFDDKDLEDDQLIQIPDLPRSLHSKRDFECPYCFTICGQKTLKKAAWELHVIRDLRPYICTYPDCQQSDQLYDTFHDWVAHEVHMHGTRYVSSYQHPQGLPSVSDMQSMSENIKSARSEDRCPFCLKAFEDKEKLRGHIASHLRRISLFALPRSTSFDDDRTNKDAASGRANASSKSSILSRENSDRQSTRSSNGEHSWEDESVLLSGIYQRSLEEPESGVALTTSNLDEHNLKESGHLVPNFFRAESSITSDSSRDSGGLISTAFENHWARKVFEDLPETPLPNYGASVECYGEPIPNARNNLRPRFKELLCIDFQQNWSVSLFWRTSDNRARILISNGQKGESRYYCLPFNLLICDAKKSSVLLARPVKEESVVRLWAKLMFSTVEQQIIFQCTFVALRAQDLHAHMSTEQEVGLDEDEFFGGRLVDDGRLHALRILRHKVSKAIRLQASVLEGELRNSPMWVVFIHRKLASRDTTWLRKAGPNTLCLRNCQCHVFSNDYNSPTNSHGEKVLEFEVQSDVEDFMLTIRDLNADWPSPRETTEKGDPDKEQAGPVGKQSKHQIVDD